jgi:chromosome segregation ATPase
MTSEKEIDEISETSPFNNEIEKLNFALAQRDETIKSLEDQLGQRGEAIRIFETTIQEKNLEIKILQDKLNAQLADTVEHKQRIESISLLNERLAAKEKELEKLEESILLKDKDLETLAGKVMAVDGEIRKVEEKLLGREKKINNLEVSLATSEDNVKELEKQLSCYKGDEKLSVQLREKEELIRQLKGTLESKEKEFSKLYEENRKYKRQQKFESEGLKQIEEQKASKRWWKHW